MTVCLKLGKKTCSLIRWYCLLEWVPIKGNSLERKNKRILTLRERNSSLPRSPTKRGLLRESQWAHLQNSNVRIDAQSVSKLLAFLTNNKDSTYSGFIFFIDIAIPVPIGCALTFAMATPAGFGAFFNNRVNELFKIILNDYGRWLTTADSQYVLVSDIPGGWFSPKALEAMPNFAETFPCDPCAPYWGYASFDAFFTRAFYDSAWLIAFEDDDNVVVNACENAPYQISYSVGRYEAFWIKSQPYSLQYILNNDEELIKEFEGGTIYQGFFESPYISWIPRSLFRKGQKGRSYTGHLFLSTLLHWFLRQLYCFSTIPRSRSCSRYSRYWSW